MFGKRENTLGVEGKVLMNVAANRKIISLAKDRIGTRFERAFQVRVRVHCIRVLSLCRQCGMLDRMKIG